jgi:hypothetical protein
MLWAGVLVHATAYVVFCDTLAFVYKDRLDQKYVRYLCISNQCVTHRLNRILKCFIRRFLRIREPCYCDHF